MKKVERWKWIVIILTFIVMLLTALPSTGIFENSRLAKYFPKKVNLGLDLQGGTHVVFEADIDVLKSKLKESGKKFTEKDLDDAIDRALEILRKRVDKFGVSEPVIQRSGKNRIVVELAGIKDPDRVAKVVGKTAFLEFKLVANVNPADYVDKDGKLVKPLPKNMELRFGKDERSGKTYPVILRKDVVVAGSSLKDAYVSMQNTSYVVAIRFNPKGASEFARITGKYKGRQLAILLDNTVISAPRINSEIPNGEAIIEGGFTLKTARDLALILKTGALPVPLKIAEQRTIGASLGKDSVMAGLRSIFIGFAIVVLFMLIYYKTSGLIADIALIFNLIIILGILVLFNATLTLPGMAGIILTIGTSVDANVLIFERIREELRNGKSVGKAVENGFSRAFVTILDANVTTIITAIVLYNFGTGPIKGFAVTLIIGILASMFTALFVSKVIFQSMLYGRNIKKLSI